MDNYRVYILVNERKTYVGITNNMTRRLRQHNGELVGGARYTTMNKGLGEWKIHSFINGLTKSKALSIEKRIKLRSRKQSGSAIERRLKAIDEVLNMEGNYKLEMYE